MILRLSSDPVILQNPADVIPCYGRLPLVDPATGLEYNCGLYGGVECPQNSFCHHTQTFAKCCPKGILKSLKCSFHSQFAVKNVRDSAKCII